MEGDSANSIREGIFGTAGTRNLHLRERNRVASGGQEKKIALGRHVRNQSKRDIKKT